MKTLHLDNLENEVYDLILERGSDYYLEGRVSPEGKNGDWTEFTVKGTEPYSVRLKIAGNEVKEYICDCPYDMGPVCKHIAACLYYLRAEQKKKSNKKASTTGKMSPNEKRLVSAIRHAKGRSGYIDWDSADDLGNVGHEILDEAEEAYGRGAYRSCAESCLLVLSYLTETLNYADDSSGYLGDAIRYSYDLLKRMATEKIIDEDTRKDLLTFCMDSFLTRKFGDWDWHMGMMELAESLASNEEEAKQIIEAIQKMCPRDSSKDEYLSGHDYETGVSIILKLKESFFPDEANSYMESHLDLNKIRDAAIDKALSHEDIDKARKLALDGIDNTPEGLPGVILHWQFRLFRIALIANDSKDIIRYAEQFWIEDFNLHWPNDGDTCYDYYNIIKEIIGEASWPQYISTFSEKLHREAPWFSKTYPELCVREKWWEKLLDFLAEKMNAGLLKDYEKYLKKDYSQELVNLYSRLVYKELGSGTGRRTYKEVCSYLRRMRKLGGEAQVQSTIADLRMKYPRRPALLDELDNV